MLRFALSWIILSCVHSPLLSQSTPVPELIPSANVSASRVSLLLRIPANLIAKAVNCEFEQDSPVNQVILGMNSKGVSHCSGKVSCVIQDNPLGVSILCCIAGKVVSKTCGENGPAIIDSTAETHYLASKSLTFDGNVFACNPSTVKSRTEITITSIRSRLPGLRGRLVTRIATKRADASHAQAIAIVNSQTESELCEKIDADFEIKIADLNRQFEGTRAVLDRFPVAKKHLYLRSAKDGVEVALGLSPSNFLDEKNRKSIGESVEFWIRRSEDRSVAGPVATMLFSQATAGLTASFAEKAMFLKHGQPNWPNQPKWEVELQNNWIVVSLHE